MSNNISGVPALVVVDTCSLLDLVRVAARRKTIGAGEITAAKAIYGAVTSSNAAVGLGISDVVQSEFAANVDQVVGQTKETLRSLRHESTHADEVAKLLGLSGILATSFKWEEALVDTTRRLAFSLLDVSAEIRATGEDIQGAYYRTLQRIPPARQGSQATHDCVITEQALRLAQGRQAGTTLLLSGNTRDFGSQGQRLHPDLQVEFQTAGLEYCTSWGEIQGRIGLPDP